MSCRASNCFSSPSRYIFWLSGAAASASFISFAASSNFPCQPRVNEPLIRLLLRVFAENSECFLGSLLGLQLAREHVHLQRAGKVQRSL